MRAELLLLLVFVGCNGDIEKENVGTTSDAGTPAPNDGGNGTLDGTIIDGSTDGGTVIDAAARNCAKDGDCNGGTCFEGLCMCNGGKHVQPDGRCGDTPPKTCSESGGTCRQNEAVCESSELEGDIGTDMSCGDLIAAVCCFDKAKCKTTVDFVCCGASTTPYEPNCVNGWRTCAGGGPLPKLRSSSCP